MSDLAANIQTGYELGWSFTPLHGKRPFQPGWQAAPRESIEQALAWAAAGNVGIRTGSASGGLLVVDFDANKPDYDPLVAASLGLPATIGARTGGGGFHAYYQLPAGVTLGNSAGRLGPAIDTRGEGGQVVYPGSVHPETGRLYEWLPGRAPGEIGLAELPAAIIERLQSSPEPAQPAQPSPPNTAAGPATAGAQQPGDRAAKYGRNALAAEMTRVSAAGQGTRNHTLNEAAYALGQLIAGGVLAEADVVSGLLGAALACGLPKGEAMRTIASGLQAGKAEPRGVPEPTHSPRTRPPGQVAGGPGTSVDGLPPERQQTAAGGGGAPVDSGGDDYDATDDDGYTRLGQHDPDSGRLVLSPRRTLPTSKAYIRDFATRPEGRTLHAYGGRMFGWNSNRYCECDDGAIRHQLQPWMHEALTYVPAKHGPELAPFPANPATVSAALETIRADVHIDQAREAPFWLSADPSLPNPREILPCRTVNLHIPSEQITPATPDLFTFNALEFDVDLNAARPGRWLAFLEQLWHADSEAIELLQEWFGYCLTPDTSQQKMLLIVGPRRSGKGTIGRVLTELIGRQNVVGPTTASLAGPFGLQPLLGRSVAIVSDARFNGADIQPVVERLLCISGEDSVTVDRKHMESLTVRLPIRFTFLSNEVPRLKDIAGALAGRFLVLTLQESFYGREDPALTAGLLAELPGILAWALEGWARLRARGRFKVPASSQETETMLIDLTSPVGAFLREVCVVAPDQRVGVDELYKAWRAWCEQDGRPVSNRQNLGRELLAVIPGLKCRRNHVSGRFYEGVGLSAASLPLPVPPPADLSPPAAGQEED